MSNLQNQNHLSILLYHQIGQQIHPKTNLDCFCLLDEFQKQMQYLFTQGYQVITLQSATAAIKNGALPAGNNIVLTFDDGCEQFTELVLPILQALNFPATIYPVAGYLGKKAGWGKIKNPELKIMPPEMVRSLHRHGMELGAHSLSHPKLSQLSLAAAEKEISQSKANLEQLTGAPVRSFAYPHGDFNASTIKLAQQAGFENALSCIPASVRPKENPFALPRKYITYFDTLASFKAKVNS